MMLQRSFLVGLAALLLVVGSAQARQDPVLDFVAVGTLEVGPDGSVHDYTLENDLDPAVAALVDRAVRAWDFEPVLVDGKPVIAVTRMRLELEALPRGDDYALRVADVSLGEPDPASRQAPAYPPGALDERLSAKVTLLLKVEADGTVQDVHVEQVSLDKRMGKRGERFRDYFAEASREAALRWTFDMGEIIDGAPVAAQFRVPVEFEMRRADGWGTRSRYLPGPYHPSPWGTPARPGPDAPMLANGEVQPLDSRVKLRDEVVGSLL